MFLKDRKAVFSTTPKIKVLNECVEVTFEAEDVAWHGAKVIELCSTCANWQNAQMSRALLSFSNQIFYKMFKYKRWQETSCPFKSQLKYSTLINLHFFLCMD